jgi:proteasome lid subunit RPN8/RPN11
MPTIEEDLRSIEINEEDLVPRNPRLKKTFATFVGVVLVLLMLSFIIVSYPIGEIIRGQMESRPLAGNMIELDDFSIILSDGTDKQLQDIYFNEQEVEFSACLLGRKAGKDYIIESLYQPKMFQQSFNHVSFQPCSSDTLIMLHSHPYKSCLASSTDLNTLRQTKERNPEVMMVVMCEPGRFSVYS